MIDNCLTLIHILLYNINIIFNINLQYNSLIQPSNNNFELIYYFKNNCNITLIYLILYILNINSISYKYIIINNLTYNIKYIENEYNKQFIFSLFNNIKKQINNKIIPCNILTQKISKFYLNNTIPKEYQKINNIIYKYYYFDYKKKLNPIIQKGGNDIIDEINVIYNLIQSQLNTTLQEKKGLLEQNIKEYEHNVQEYNNNHKQYENLIFYFRKMILKYYDENNKPKDLQSLYASIKNITIGNNNIDLNLSIKNFEKIVNKIELYYVSFTTFNEYDINELYNHIKNLINKEYILSLNFENKSPEFSKDKEKLQVLFDSYKNYYRILDNQLTECYNKEVIKFNINLVSDITKDNVNIFTLNNNYNKKQIDKYLNAINKYINNITDKLPDEQMIKEINTLLNDYIKEKTEKEKKTDEKKTDEKKTDEKKEKGKLSLNSKPIHEKKNLNSQVKILEDLQSFKLLNNYFNKNIFSNDNNERILINISYDVAKLNPFIQQQTEKIKFHNDYIKVLVEYVSNFKNHEFLTELSKFQEKHFNKTEEQKITFFYEQYEKILKKNLQFYLTQYNEFIKSTNLILNDFCYLYKYNKNISNIEIYNIFNKYEDILMPHHKSILDRWYFMEHSIKQKKKDEIKQYLKEDLKEILNEEGIDNLINNINNKVNNEKLRDSYIMDQQQNKYNQNFNKIIDNLSIILKYKQTYNPIEYGLNSEAINGVVKYDKQGWNSNFLKGILNNEFFKTLNVNNYEFNTLNLEEYIEKFFKEIKNLINLYSINIINKEKYNTIINNKKLINAGENFNDFLKYQYAYDININKLQLGELINNLNQEGNEDLDKFILLYKNNEYLLNYDNFYYIDDNERLNIIITFNYLLHDNIYEKKQSYGYLKKIYTYLLNLVNQDTYFITLFLLNNNIFYLNNDDNENFEKEVKKKYYKFYFTVKEIDFKCKLELKLKINHYFVYENKKYDNNEMIFENYKYGNEQGIKIGNITMLDYNLNLFKLDE